MMDVDWSSPVRTQHRVPMVGHILPSSDGRHRVALPSLSAQNPTKNPTVYLYGDNGVSRVDGQASEYDLVNFDPADGVEVLRCSEDALERRA